MLKLLGLELTLSKFWLIGFAVIQTKKLFALTYKYNYSIGFVINSNPLNTFFDQLDFERDFAQGSNDKWSRIDHFTSLKFLILYIKCPKLQCPDSIKCMIMCLKMSTIWIQWLYIVWKVTLLHCMKALWIKLMHFRRWN